MAMDFWEAQRQARKKTAVYLAIFITMSLVVAAGVELAFRFLSEDAAQLEIPIVGPIFLLMTMGAAGFEYLMFRSFGGSYVAKSVGAIQIDPNTSDPKERQLLNIVEEIAIAASLPVPPVYIMPAHQINAFAAGLTSDNAAIAVTRGTLDTLNRDEIQGVVAHEFGHIANGDMKVSLRLAAMVMGFFFVLYIGLRLLQFSGRPRGEKKGGNPVALAALLLLIAGAVTWLFGSILKASVSREREYLADASAVQFTRNPEGIANALRKIADESTKDMPSSGMAFSHLYLDNHNSLDSLFATHPPLAKRIAAIEGLPPTQVMRR